MLTIKNAERSDFHSWVQLYKQYLNFYQTMLRDEQLIVLWDWFFDDEKKIYCIIAFLNGAPIGLVHFREFLRPIKASIGIFMDDLFIRPLSKPSLCQLHVVNCCD